MWAMTAPVSLQVYLRGSLHGGSPSWNQASNLLHHDASTTSPVQRDAKQGEDVGRNQMP